MPAPGLIFLRCWPCISRRLPGPAVVFGYAHSRRFPARISYSNYNIRIQLGIVNVCTCTYGWIRDHTWSLRQILMAEPANITHGTEQRRSRWWTDQAQDSSLFNAFGHHGNVNVLPLVQFSHIVRAIQGGACSVHDAV
ncbi:hypothetical protein D3C72_1132000 [compost metagenome]